MRKAAFSILFALLVAGCLAQQKASSIYQWSKLGDVGDASEVNAGYGLGVASPFAGVVNGRLVVAGGCNFPGKAAADGGTKAYYDDVYVFDLKGKSRTAQKLSLKLPAALAYGASVQIPSGVVFLGGRNDSIYSRKVLHLSWDSAKGSIAIIYLPDLPVGKALFGATYSDRKIYVVGAEAVSPYQKVFLVYDFRNPKKGWTRLPDYPGVARTLPAVVAQSNGDEVQVYMFFGATANGASPYILDSYMAYSIKSRSWAEGGKTLFNGKPICFYGGDAFSSGTNDILFIGGVNVDVFRTEVQRRATAKVSPDKQLVDSLKAVSDAYMRADRSFYRFNSKVMAFSLITNTWTELQDAPYGGITGEEIVADGKTIFVVSGEIKPGVRTPDVYKGLLKRIK